MKSRCITIIRTFTFGLIILFALSGLNAQTGGAGGAGANAISGSAGSTVRESIGSRLDTPEGRALIASTTSDYLVTPGDVYLLSFLKSTTTTNLTAIVELDYSVNLSVFGRLDVRGLIFRELKAKVETLVEKAYPGSTPNLLFQNTGVFNVLVQGEVVSAGQREAWALTRLSEIVEGSANALASRRSVMVRSSAGTEKRYDLFKASRYGDLTQDPYVRPGDKIVLDRFERMVSITGEIRRPGKYELLSEDGISQLLDLYGDGLMKTARADYASLVKRASKDNLEGAAQFFDAANLPKSGLPPLSDGDSVYVPSRESYLPVVYYEGAIATGTEPAGKYATDRQLYKPGDKLSRSLRLVAARIAPTADLRRAFVARKGKADTIPIDLEKLLFSYDPADDIELAPEDRVVIPYGSLDVFVTGEVVKSSWVTTSATTRLSTAVSPFLTKFSSIRDILVKNTGGEEKHFDLFRSERYGELDQDPFLKPGDVVTVRRFTRLVTISGEVKRQGSYQLLDGEGLSELIDAYGEGLTKEARADYASLVKKASGDNPDGGALFFDALNSAGAKLPPLSDGDTIYIPARESYLPVVYYEGAIETGIEKAKSTDTNKVTESIVKYGTERQPYKPGDMLSRNMRQVTSRIAPTADLRRAFVARKGKADTIPVDLEKLLFAFDPTDDIELAPEDRIVIPYGSLDVFVTGEVTKSSWVNTAALTRLSTAVGPLLTPFSSVRDIVVKNSGGEEKRFDLFRAERYGELDQDPFLKPGDVVSLGRLTRAVLISGEVKRQGTYQLLDGEGLSELVNIYGEGLTKEARAEYASLVKKASGDNPEGGALFFDASTVAPTGLPPLSDGDTVYIPTRESYLPIVYYEGAIVTETEKAKSTDTEKVIAPVIKYGTERQPYKPGDKLSRNLRQVIPRIAPTADLRRAFVARKGKTDTIPVDLEKLLYAFDPADDIDLAPEDRIVIPYGSLDVFVTGEVTKSSWVSTAALTRLSAAVGPLLTRFSSVRDIIVKNTGGEEKRYDLFRAERYGDLEQDPFLKPGDVVTVGRFTRAVAISGEVKRQGTYQLLDGDGLSELISAYGEGLTKEARADYASLMKRASGDNPEGGALFFDAANLATPELPPLSDGDTVYVPARESYLPIVYYEGAIATGTEAAGKYATDRQPFKPGDKLSRSLRQVAARIAPTADLRRAFVARKGKADTIPVDLEKLLYSYDPADDVELAPEDRIVIPYGSLDVFVTGEVTKSSWVNTAALTRLSAAVGPLLTRFSSIRDISVKNVGGEEMHFDLFRADRNGELDQDPFLKPGDVVTVGRFTRSVTISGEVKRQGSYQLLAGEGLFDLIWTYGEGLTKEARADYSSLVKRANGDNPEGGALFFDAANLAAPELPPLSDGDTVYVPARESYLPIVYYEGAIATGPEPAGKYATDRQPFKPGDKLSRSLRQVAARIAPTADLRRAFVARKGKADTIPVDLEKLLYSYDPVDDVELAPEDRIVIPYGSLDVFVTGEVTKSTWVNTAALTRLSAAVAPLLTRFSSIRDISVKNVGGEEMHFDLFRADRNGELDQDPFLKPGDVVTVGRFTRSVTISGEVKRQGTYQILDGEGLSELISAYGEGLTKEARADYASLMKRASRDNPEGGALFFDAVNLASPGLPPLSDGDTVYVPACESYLPIVYYEGAIATGTEAAGKYATDRQPFKPGDKLSRSLRQVAARIAPTADLRRAFVARKGKADTIPVDLEKLLYAYDPADDVELAAEDRIVIPYGSLDVFVTGEVTKSTWVNTAALTRLSVAIGPFLTKYSSIRDISVKTSGSHEKRYDLFRAEREGDLEQDPFLKPGDVVTVGKYSTVVTISGEVKRPGTYQLLGGEDFKDLIEYYAGGLTAQANPRRISMLKSPSASKNLGELHNIDFSSTSDAIPSCYDIYTVPSIYDLLPVAYFEGAISVSDSAKDLNTSNRVSHQFMPGTMLSQATQALRKSFSSVSDLAHAYLLRGTEKIPVDITNFVYKNDFSKDIELAANDTVIVPFRQFFVSVSGAVRAPGRFPYIPDRGWDYYIGLAGGFNEDLNSGQEVKIVDLKGNTKTKRDSVEPEDTITAASNSFLYFLNKVSGVLSTVISVASLVLTLIRL